MCSILAACGGGGGSSTSTSKAGATSGDGGSGTPSPTPVVTPPPAYQIPSNLWSAPSGAVPASGNYVYLQSDAGDYIGGGRTTVYTNADTQINMSYSGLTVNASLSGNQNWRGGFMLPSAAGTLQAGYFGDLTRTPFADPKVGGVEWSGDGRGCNTIKGWVVIDKVSIESGVLQSLDLRFEQHCEGGTPALHGQIHWNKADVTAGQPTGPASIPADLWRASTGNVPASGNYVYLESTAGDFIGGGRSYSYTQTNSVIKFGPSGGHLNVSIAGNQNWTGDFQAMGGMTQLSAGYYGGLNRYPFNNPVLGGLSWSGEGRACNTLSGWFVVDKATYDGSTLTALDLRFEQHCEGGASALHGQIHWNKADVGTGQPAGPAPIPADLWRASTGNVPATGNYVYLESTSGDFIGGGRSYSYNPTNSTIKLNPSGAYLNVSVAGNQNWTGDFQGMSGMTQLSAGYYGGLSRYPFHNPVLGGLSWSGDGRGCNTVSGWFVVDKATYEGSTLTALDLRFEQHCEGGAPALHGQIHWNKADVGTGQPTGPAPIPANLWRASLANVPATGNYVYLESTPGDYIGGGRNYSYDQTNSTIKFNPSGAYLNVSVAGNQNWTGDFQGMSGMTQLSAGYYGGLSRYPFNNAVLGGLNWSGDGRGCNTLSGWFVVDKVTYSGSTLTALDLRFEQHCEGGTSALRGQLHWVADDASAPSGPVNPPPATLWKPSTSFVPPSGNYVYLVSDPGDYIGGGRTELLTSANSTLNVTTNLTAALRLSVGGWGGDFVGMTGLSQLQPGYYGGLQRYPFHNAAKGGLNWSGNGRGCNTLSGWFVVDSVSYSMGQLTAIDLRFEQHCEGGTPAQRGVIHWAK